MTLKDLKAKLARFRQELRTIADSPEGDGGDLSAEQETRFDTLRGEVETTEKQIGRQELIDEIDRRAEGETLAGTGDDQFDRELRSFSLVRAIGAQVPDLNVDAGREREISAELARRSGQNPDGMMVPMAVFQRPMEQRVITTAAPGAGPGSNIIATDHLGAQYIDILRAKLVTRRLGARVLNDLHGNVDIPRLKVSATSGWVAEDAALSASDMAFAKVQMSPKHVGCLVEYSRNMIQQSSPDIEQLVRDDFAGVLAREVDDVAIEGGGSNEPTGIIKTSGIGAVAMATNGSAITWDAVINLIAEVEIDDAEGSAFLTNPKAIKSARKVAKVTSTDSVMVMEGPGQLAGYPVASSTLVPSDLTKGSGSGLSALIFGNFADLLIGYWSAFDLLVNPYETTAYTKGNVQVRGMLTCDVAVRHPESFAAITDLVTR